MPFASKQWPISCVATINSSIFFSFITCGYVWRCRWVTIATLSFVCTCLLTSETGLLSAAQCDTVEFECIKEKMRLSREFAGCWLRHLPCENFDWHLPCWLFTLCVALWPGMWLPVTHQPLAHYLCWFVMVNLSTHSLWNDRPNSYQQLIT